MPNFFDVPTINNLKSKQLFKPQKTYIHCLLYLLDKRIACGSKKIFIYNIESINIDLILEGHFGEIYSIIQPNENNLISCSQDRTIRIWDLNNKKQIKYFIGHLSSIFKIINIKFYNDLICSCSEDKTIKIWNISNEEKNFTIKGHFDAVYSILEINDEIKSEIKYLLSMSNDETLKFWKFNIENKIYENYKTFLEFGSFM